MSSFEAEGRTPPLLPRRLEIGNPTGSLAVPLDVSNPLSSWSEWNGSGISALTVVTLLEIMFVI